jgi:hypothetical protein
MISILSLALALTSSQPNTSLLQFPDSAYSSDDARDLDDYCTDQVGEMDEPDSLDVVRCHEYAPDAYPLPAVSERLLIAPDVVALASIRPIRVDAPRFETTCSISCPD